MSLHERLGIGLILAGGAVLFAQRAIAAWLEQRPRRGAELTPHGNKLPSPLHAVLEPQRTAYKRVIILGDIHGCPDELQALLDKLRYRRGVDLLLSVGDLVNKGPDSEKVLRMAREEGMVAVRGNHDDSAYEAFRAWLDGRDIPKARKQGWVAGLEAGLAELLSQLPFTLQLPAYGVLLVHAGLVPGRTLEQQRLADLEAMRDVVPASEADVADAAAAALAAGEPPGSLPTGDFDWEAASLALARMGDAAANGGGSAGGGSGGGGGGSLGAAGSSGGAGAAAAAELPAELRLAGRERPNPLGRAWAAAWRGPPFVFFGHDAKRRLQLHPAACGLDTGCVYGGQLTAAVLPPLDEAGRPLPQQRLNLPPGAQEHRLPSGLPFYLVQVEANEVYSSKFQQAEQEVKARRQEAAKAHTQAALAAQHAQHAQHAQQHGAAGAVELSPAAAGGAAPKAAAEKKRE